MKEIARRALPPRIWSALSLAARFARGVGLRHRCPLCGWPLRRFLPGGEQTPVLTELRVIGAGPRTRFACPLCFSMDRERLVHLYLARRTRLLASDRPGEISVLHVAPEGGLRRVFRRAGFRYVTADLSLRSVRARADVCRLPFRGGAFDLIVCNHVLEHVADDRAAMRELLTVLRPGGLAFLQVPLSPLLDETREDPSVVDPAERERLFGQHDHLRLYGPDYPRRLEESGFAVERFRFREEYGPGETERFGLLPDEVLHVCRRPD